MKIKNLLLCCLISIMVLVCGCDGNSSGVNSNTTQTTTAVSSTSKTVIESQTTTTKNISDSEQTTTGQMKQSGKQLTESAKLSNVPEYAGNDFEVINNNAPLFSDDYLSSQSYEFYGELDNLGRCTVGIANIGKDIMPTEKRGSIGMIKPSGWHLDKYDFVDGRYLYNRCHLVGYQLSGENANEKNLITGTRYMNIGKMLDIENQVANYVKSSNNHVLYRVTPIFVGNELVARGVLMEAKSCEDNGKSICLCVFCFNVQPNVIIDYTTGDNKLNSTVTTESVAVTTTNQKPAVTTKTDAAQGNNTTVYVILNTNTKKYHEPSCSSVSKIKAANKQEYRGSLDALTAQGYTPCKICH